VVFDRVVSTALQQFGHIGPAAAFNPVMQVQNPFFFFFPGSFVDFGVQVIVPPNISFRGKDLNY